MLYLRKSEGVPGREKKRGWKTNVTGERIDLEAKKMRNVVEPYGELVKRGSKLAEGTVLNGQVPNAVNQFRLDWKVTKPQRHPFRSLSGISPFQKKSQAHACMLYVSTL